MSKTRTCPNGGGPLADAISDMARVLDAGATLSGRLAVVDASDWCARERFRLSLKYNH